VFWVLLIAHLLPFLAFPWFPTVDGPGHLYNARIIHDLAGGDVQAADFFRLNPFPEPNWLGHAIMAALLALVPACVAEKALLLLYAMGLPLAFRWCVRAERDHDPWMILLIFPFVISYPARMGFFNYSLSLVLLLVVLGAWLRWLDHMDMRRRAILLLWLLLLWFAHLSNLLLAFALMALAAVLRPSQGRAGAFASIALLCAPFALLGAWYAVHHTGSEHHAAQRFPIATLLSWLRDGRPFVSLSDGEVVFTRWFVIALLVGSIWVLVKAPYAVRSTRSIHWVAALVLLAAVFILPDSMAAGKFLTPRLMLLVWMFAALAIASGPVPNAARWCTLVVLLGADAFALRYHMEKTRALNIELAELLEVGAHIGTDDVVVPFNQSDNWLHSNFSAYLGATTGAMVLDNFLANTPTSPVLWANTADRGSTWGNFATSTRPCFDTLADPRGGSRATKALWWSWDALRADSCTAASHAWLRRHSHKSMASPTGRAVLFYLR
jgi:hypothetical protein